MHKVYHFNLWCSIDLPVQIKTDKYGDTHETNVSTPITLCEPYFSAFLDLCFEHATSFSLQKGNWPNSTNPYFEQRLAPYELQTIHTKKWFGYDYTGSWCDYEYTMCQKQYKPTEEAKAVLKELFHEIFLGYGDDTPRVKYNLEDLCFFKEDSLFVGTVSHEHMLCVFPPDDAFEQSIQKLGRWKDAAGRIEPFSLKDIK